MTPQQEKPQGSPENVSPENVPPINDAAAISELLTSAKTIAVVGLSSKSFRPSYGVSRYMQSAGFRIIPVNPNETQILGEKSYPRLQDVPEKIDIVDVFRHEDHVSNVIDDAIAVGARAVWLQEGIVDEASAQRARAAGIFVVMDRCIFKEFSKRDS